MKMADFERNFKRTSRMVWVVFVINMVIAMVFLGGLGWLVYVLLKHFGIIG